MTSSLAIQGLVAYYERKTEAIIQRYGPGPRVHYHTGLIDEAQPPAASSQVLRQRLVAGQERMLYHAAAVWRADSSMRGEVLDVGCGLGGGAIFWAQEFGVRVTAVTCVPSHADWVSRFAAQAGVESRVRPLVCDALEIPGHSRFDAVVAVDSSGYLPRGPWFQRLSSLLHPGGRVLILDCFLARPEYEQPFNRHWFTRIGTIAEYLTEADRAGLCAEFTEDLSSRTEHFWTTTLALLGAEAREEHQSSNEKAQQKTSIRMHKLVRQGLVDGGLTYALMSFSKPA